MYAWLEDTIIKQGFIFKGSFNNYKGYPSRGYYFFMTGENTNATDHPRESSYRVIGSTLSLRKHSNTSAISTDFSIFKFA